MCNLLWTGLAAVRQGAQEGPRIALIQISARVSLSAGEMQSSKMKLLMS